jgi:hypothetical protein
MGNLDSDPTPTDGSVPSPQPNPDPAPTPPQNNSAGDNRDWQAELETADRRYRGLRGIHNKVLAERDQLSEERDTLTSQFEEHKANTGKTIEDLTRERDLLQAQNAEFQKKLTEVERRQEIASEISEKFPLLSDWWNQGLLPGVDQLEGEEREQYLQSFQEKLESQMDTEARERQRGKTPRRPAPSTDDTPESLEDLAAKLKQHRVGSEEYNRIREQYMKQMVM